MPDPTRGRCHQPIRLDGTRWAPLRIDAAGARQGHGYRFEHQMCAILGLQHISGGKEFDAVDGDGHHYSFKAVQVRESGRPGDVCLGDLMRNARRSDDATTVVAAYRKVAIGDGTVAKVVVAIYVFDTPAELWRALFPQRCLDEFSSRKVFWGISNDPGDDERWKVRQTRLLERWHAAQRREGFDSPIVIAPKRDHKKQMRVQCRIPAADMQRTFEALYDPVRTKLLEDHLDAWNAEHPDGTLPAPVTDQLTFDLKD